MTIRFQRAAGLVVLAGLLLAVGATAQTRRLPPPRTPPRTPTPRPATITPKFEVWAETRLLMEGLNGANYRGIARLLKEKPPDNDTWIFVRGQALLIAETGNLLLLRPPRNAGRDAWYRHAMDLRAAAGNLARRAGARDFAGTKAALTGLTGACNRCHQTFRVPVRITPEPEEGPKEPPAPKEPSKVRPKAAGKERRASLD
jgi:hypothetical protein